MKSVNKREYVWKVVRKSFAKRLNIFANIFGYSALFAVIIGLVITVLVNYFIPFLLFIVGMTSGIYIISNEKLFIDLASKNIKRIKHWIVDMMHPNHC